MDHATVYRSAHDRIRELVSAENADIEVPACPGWSVKDLVAHLAGFFAAYSSGDDDAFGPSWGERKVKARAGMSLDECLAEWDRRLRENTDLFESRLGLVAVADVLAHEQDLRSALDRPGARDELGIVPAIQMGLSFVGKKVDNAGLPAFRVVTEDVDTKVGSGEVGATLRTSTFELFRALHGRRTVDQVRALEWDGDPAPWMDVFFLFGPTHRVVEA